MQQALTNINKNSLERDKGMIQAKEWGGSVVSL